MKKLSILRKKTQSRFNVYKDYIVYYEGQFFILTIDDVDLVDHKTGFQLIF